MKNKKNIHGFKAPEGYFENFEEALFNKMELDDLPKEAGFTVPKDYFDTLDDRIMEQVNTPEPKVISLFSRKRMLYFTAVAASLALIITLFRTTEVDTLESLQLSSIADYIEDGNLELDSYDYMALLDNDAITTLTLETEIASEENLEDYLLEMIDDNTLLLE